MLTNLRPLRLSRLSRSHRFLLLWALVFGLAETAGATQVDDPYFSLVQNEIHVPVGFFVLVRKGSEIGAFRLTSAALDANGNGESNYESYFQPDGSGVFGSSKVTRRIGKIWTKEPWNFGHVIGHSPGQRKLWIGKWWLGCVRPDLVLTTLHFSEKDVGFEFAPTAVADIRLLNPSDKNIRWFHAYQRDRVTLSLHDLVK